MGWRDRIRQPASFRGVFFTVASGELACGRRTVKHTYPQRDETFSEDMGRAPRSFPVEAFLVTGPVPQRGGSVVIVDMLKQLEDLIEALETQGPGELVHPWFGKKSVIVASFRARVSKDEGGFVALTIDFDETDETPAFPTVTIDAPAELRNSAVRAVVAVNEDLAAIHNLEGLAAGAIAGIAAVLSSAGSQLDTSLGPITAAAQAQAKLKRSLARLRTQAHALARAPLDLLELLGDMLESLVPADPRAGVAALLAAYGFTPTSSRPVASTAKRLRAQATFDAMQRTLQRLLLIKAARVAIDGVAAGSYASYDDALATRAAVLAALDAQLELASDLVFPALMQLRADLVRAVPGDDSELAHLVTYTPPGTVPSLVLSHRLYGHLDAEADLIARNRLKHPGFILGSRALEVLSSAQG